MLIARIMPTVFILLRCTVMGQTLIFCTVKSRCHLWLLAICKVISGNNLCFFVLDQRLVLFTSHPRY